MTDASFSSHNIMSDHDMKTISEYQQYYYTQNYEDEYGPIDEEESDFDDTTKVEEYCDCIANNHDYNQFVNLFNDENLNEIMTITRSKEVVIPPYTSCNIDRCRRAIVFDWLIEVHFDLKLCDATLFLCFGIFDRYMYEKYREGKRFQLVGIASLLILF